MTYGVDVAKSRVDDLDKLLLEQVTASNQVTVLDLGCGSGGMSVRLAEAGADVLSLDILDYTTEFADAIVREPALKGKVRFKQGDMNNLVSMLGDQTFDYCLFQRSLHYLSYEAAVFLLHYLKKIVTKKMFISVTGLESDIGKFYPAKLEIMQNRFAKLLPEEAEKFYIHAPICLYRKEEFVALLEETGWEIEKVWTSAFLNHKAVVSVRE